MNIQIMGNDSNKISTTYDLVSAVKRQIPFCYQVLRPHMKDNTFLEEAVGRYKGFLYLIKRNQEMSITQFCVPTYDIDLIWHSHQLHPISYCKDLVSLVGRVLQHDDTDSDRTKGRKLDTGFTKTTKQWEDTFGTRYWRAGAMYRGTAPSPLTNKSIVADEYQSMIQIPNKMFMEVMLEIVGMRGSTAGRNGKLLLTVSKKQTDKFLNGKRRLILSESGEKRVTVFQCEPIGDLVFELVSYSPAFLQVKGLPEVLGTTSFSLQDLMRPGYSLSLEKWFEFGTNSQPIDLRIALSFTPPVPAPFMFSNTKEKENASKQEVCKFSFQCDGYGACGTVNGDKKMAESSICGGSGLCSNCGGGGCIGICTITEDIESSHCGGCGGGCGGCGGGGCSRCSHDSV